MSDKAITAISACLCGCGQPTINPAANYRPGHDASHVSNLLGALAKVSGGFTQEQVESCKLQLPSPALRVKLQTAADRLADRRAKKNAPHTPRAEKLPAGVWAHVDHTVAKSGRWTYPVQEWAIPTTTTGDQPTGEFVRNTKRDGSGEWVELGDAVLVSLDED